ncbi:MAG: DUF2161 family putative PD-(D/E)XK-type phosphodiesterase [Pseudomonadota bacterium]
MEERALYGPVKGFLEAQGYEVKGEVGAADLVAVRGDEPPVIVELKLSFSLTLIHQAIARQAITDAVYVAVPHAPGRAGPKARTRNAGLCRRLGLGLLTVRVPSDEVVVHLDPAPYQPRKSAVRRVRLLKEFAARSGDPSEGGIRGARMTAYRQDALRCLTHLQCNGPTKASDVAAATGVPRSRAILSANHYGWFERVARGIYGATPKGVEAHGTFREEIARLTSPKA